jgi:hypothetical protein
MVAGRDAKIDWKALSHRIGHSDAAFTMKQYVQTDLKADHKVANTPSLCSRKGLWPW